MGHFNYFNNFSSADIFKKQLSSFDNLVGHDIDLKVDFIKYWLVFLYR